MSTEEILVFAGSGSPVLTSEICGHLGVSPAQGETLCFSDGNLFVRVLQNVRGRRTYIVQSTVFPTNDLFMELLFWIDALKRASAESVTVVMPYFSYAKGPQQGAHRIDQPLRALRERIAAGDFVAALEFRHLVVNL